MPWKKSRASQKWKRHYLKTAVQHSAPANVLNYFTHHLYMQASVIICRLVKSKVNIVWKRAFSLSSLSLKSNLYSFLTNLSLSLCNLSFPRFLPPPTSVSPTPPPPLPLPFIWPCPPSLSPSHGPPPSLSPLCSFLASFPLRLLHLSSSLRREQQQVCSRG